MVSLKSCEEIDQVWQELRGGVLFTSHDIRRYISDWGKEEKIKYLQNWIDMLSEEIKNIYQGYERMTERDVDILTKKVFLYMAGLKKREKLLKGLAMSLRLMKFSGEIKKGEITPEQIAQARDFPLTELIGVEKFPTFCPFHNDVHHPNFSVKDNRGHCFACGWSGDSIKFIMDRDKISFVETIKKLGR
ncbi:MAG: hypothetical protein COX41_01655 [Candidatus Omnitrophica bacterium CG23_combo_of_CG06-09_8_20_14_all_41_10]|uniref:Zinc finger CHC2-type domain-containing protein n=1 Tax=Candidatus Sherwoodlollariibacterium unditelluris TaxID=1974757 RepID=A0A2G9YKB2_9BACT|nr:MAG: hypothetical protein COX41_01655 [Candidatus Omnitrophica bacterium CG23_combo_of_CG06-09_8_20_14_all_41_10]